MELVALILSIIAFFHSMFWFSSTVSARCTSSQSKKVNDFGEVKIYDITFKMIFSCAGNHSIYIKYCCWDDHHDSLLANKSYTSVTVERLLKPGEIIEVEFKLPSQRFSALKTNFRNFDFFVFVIWPDGMDHSLNFSAEIEQTSKSLPGISLINTTIGKHTRNAVTPAISFFKSLPERLKKDTFLDKPKS